MRRGKRGEGKGDFESKGEKEDEIPYFESLDRDDSSNGRSKLCEGWRMLRFGLRHFSGRIGSHFCDHGQSGLLAILETTCISKKN